MSEWNIQLSVPLLAVGVLPVYCDPALAGCANAKGFASLTLSLANHVVRGVQAALDSRPDLT